MRTSAGLFSATFAFLLSFGTFVPHTHSALFAQSPTQSQDTGSVAATALAQQVNNNAGWALDWTQMKFSYTATVNSDEDPSGAVLPIQLSVEFSGNTKMKAVFQTPSGSSTSIVNGIMAQTISDGQPQFVPYDSLWESLAIFPFQSDLTSTSDPNVLTVSGATETVGPSNTSQLNFHRIPPTDRTLSRRLNMMPDDSVCWVAADTLLPIQTQISMPNTSNPNSSFPLLRVYSNYQTIGGISVPFTIQLFANGTQVATISISNIQFNVASPDTDFQIQQ